MDLSGRAPQPRPDLTVGARLRGVIAPLPLYAWSVAFAGLSGTCAVVWLDPPLLHMAQAPVAVLVLMAFLVVGELFPIPVARGDATTSNVTMSTTFAVALVVVGPMSTLLLAHLVAVLLDDLRRRRQPVQVVFNLGQYALSLLAARAVLSWSAGLPFLARYEPFTAVELLPALLAGATYAATNHVLVAQVVALASQQPLRRALGDDLRFTLETSTVLVGMGPVTALVVDRAAWMLPLVMLPIVAVRRSAQMAALSERQALRDPLTALGNRTSLQMHLDRRPETSRQPWVGMMLIDLDHFKDVNDSLGHDVGDRLLIEVAARLREVVPVGSHVARLGGDEFAVVVHTDCTDRYEAAFHVEEAAGRVLAAFADPIDLQGTRLAVRGSIGVAIASATDTVHLLKHADIALYEAKADRARVASYQAGSDLAEMERITVLVALTQAVRDDEMSVAFQPQVDCSTGRVRAFEALVRWEDPRFAHVPAGTLVQLAENAGFIDSIFDAVLDRSLAAVAGWRAGGHDVSVGVNLSARQLSDEALPDRIATALDRHGVPAAALTVEVTESSLMVDARRADVVMQGMRAVGVELSIDDFGTGYSSLVRLNQIDVDELKIDRGFVADLASGATNDLLIRTIVDLARNLSLSIVAEGVEDEWAAATLATMGCHRVQGWFTGRPMSAAAASNLLRRQALPDFVTPSWVVGAPGRRTDLRVAEPVGDAAAVALVGPRAPRSAAVPAPRRAGTQPAC